MKFWFAIVFAAVVWSASVFGADEPDGAVEPETEAPKENPRVALLLRLKDTDLSANPALRTALTQALNDTRGTPDFLELVRAFKIKDRDADLVATAIAHFSDSTGSEAMRLVLEHGSTNEIRRVLAGPEVAKVIEVLGNVGGKAATDLVAPVILDPKQTLRIREAGIHAVVQTRDGADWLLKVVGDKKLPDEVKQVAARELAGVRWPEVQEAASKILPAVQVKAADSLPPLAELVLRKGDPTLGERVFFDSAASCARCHQVRGKGVDFGPNLSEIGDKFGKDGIYPAILTPSAGIVVGYEGWQVDFKNGDDASGLITSETDDEITMKAVGGIVARYKKDTIARRFQQKTSIMPDGLGQAIGVENLINLVEFLTTLKKPAN